MQKLVIVYSLFMLFWSLSAMEDKITEKEAELSDLEKMKKLEKIKKDESEHRGVGWKAELEQLKKGLDLKKEIKESIQTIKDEFKEMKESPTKVLKEEFEKLKEEAKEAQKKLFKPQESSDNTLTAKEKKILEKAELEEAQKTLDELSLKKELTEQEKKKYTEAKKIIEEKETMSDVKQSTKAAIGIGATGLPSLGIGIFQAGQAAQKTEEARIATEQALEQATEEEQPEDEQTTYMVLEEETDSEENEEYIPIDLDVSEYEIITKEE